MVLTTCRNSVELQKKIRPTTTVHMGNIAWLSLNPDELKRQHRNWAGWLIVRMWTSDLLISASFLQIVKSIETSRPRITQSASVL